MIVNHTSLSQEDLEREYSPSSMLDEDIGVFLQRYSDDSAAARATLPVREFLQYGPSDAETLDYFSCANPQAPLHVFIHGGYWQQLSHREAASMAPAITGQNINFATLNYALAPKVHIRDMVAQCSRALVWLVEQSAQLGFDPSRMVLSGHSAGAHLAAMLINDPDKTLKRAGLSLSAAILISGIYDLEPIRHTSVNQPLNLSKSDVAALSPMAFLPTICPAIKVLVAENDTAQFKKQSRDYHKHLLSSGLQARLEVVPDHHHFDIILRPQTFTMP